MFQPEITNQYDPDADIVLFEGLVEDFLSSLPDESVQLIVTSPPYNIGKEYETRVSLDKYLETQ
jgi:site-specific DNA-methyltransferase (adenine-specific)/adenine-specific DNA-methyltransferase